MTTTTSSSRNPIKGERLFDRTFARLLAATLRQNGLTMGIYGVCLILVTVCPAFLEAKNYVEGSYLDAPELLVSSWFYGASALIVPVLLAAMLFHYLHNRLSVDFYHAMPLSRKSSFSPATLWGLCSCWFRCWSAGCCVLLSIWPFTPAG